MPRNKDAEHELPDTIRETLAARAEELGLLPSEVAALVGIDPGTVKRYLHGMNRDGKRVHIALNSRYVSAMCELLGLELRAKKRFKKTWN